MDAEAGPSNSYGHALDGDTKSLVGRDGRVMLSRQAPVELGAHVMTPLNTPPGDDGEGGPGNGEVAAGDEGKALPGPSTRGRGTRRAENADRNSLSEQYYGTSVEVGPLPPNFGTATGTGNEGNKFRTQQSRRLPFWIWFILAKSLGIRLHPGDHLWFGTLMHGVTLTFALGFAITHAWYKVYDIVSNETKETVLTGLMSIVLVLYWCSLGIYSHKLAGRLFMTPKFLDSVRLHSKTMCKISAAGVMVMLGIGEVVLNCVQSKGIFFDGFCEKVALHEGVCKTLYVMRVGCCVLTITWNILVGIILLSVCRTHTIVQFCVLCFLFGGLVIVSEGLRRFIRELEDDGRIYELYRRNLTMQGPMRSCRKDSNSTVDDNLLWEEDFSPTEDDSVFPRLAPYPLAHASPCNTPTRKGSRHTSQVSAPGPTAHLPESLAPGLVPAPVSAQSFAAINSQYFPANSQYSNYAVPPHVYTVEAEVVPGPDPSGSPSPIPPAADDSGRPGANDAVPDGRAQTQAQIPGQTQAQAPQSDTSGSGVERKVPLVSRQSRPIIIIREGSVQAADDVTEPEVCEQQTSNQQTLIAADPPSFASRSTRSGYDSPNQSTRVELGSPRRVPSSMTGVTDRSQSVDDNLSIGIHMLTTDEILLIYWKLGSRLRSTSLVLQRWLCAIMMYIIVWSVTFIVWWVKHEATFVGIGEFVIPILLLPIICSAYGEVNFEGQRMLKSICPTQQRMDMLFFMTQNPLQLTAFGFVINYGLIAGALGALGIALCTRLVLDEVNM